MTIGFSAFPKARWMVAKALLGGCLLAKNKSQTSPPSSFYIWFGSMGCPPDKNHKSVIYSKYDHIWRIIHVHGTNGLGAKI